MTVVEVHDELRGTTAAEVGDLLRRVEQAVGRRPLSDHLWLDLVAGGRAGFVGAVQRADDGHLAGYAQASRASDSYAIEVVAAPDESEPLGTVIAPLLRAVLAEIGRRGGGTVHWWVSGPGAEHEAVAAQLGLAPGRRLHQMRRELPGVDQLAPGVEVRPFRPGRDESAWLALNNRAFAGHPEQGDWTLDTLLAREAEPWFDPEGFLLHERDDELLAFCWTKLHFGTEPELGEIYVIAVDPAAHGLGLGRALTLAGLRSIRARGVTTAMLFVDADNAAATATYERLGFAVHHTDRTFSGLVPATESAASQVSS